MERNVSLSLFQYYMVTAAPYLAPLTSLFVSWFCTNIYTCLFPHLPSPHLRLPVDSTPDSNFLFSYTFKYVIYSSRIIIIKCNIQHFSYDISNLVGICVCFFFFFYESPETILLENLQIHCTVECIEECALQAESLEIECMRFQLTWRE